MVRAKHLGIAAVLCLALGTKAHAFCFEEAGAEYSINPQILRAIAKVESNFNPRAFNRNSNGTFDFGLMQINSIWASTLGKERWNTLGDACSNAKAGAYILSMCMAKYGYTWKAIGCYNSQTPGKSEKYARAVFEQLQRVKPQPEEAAYSPVKDRLEVLVKDKVDEWVAGAVQGNSGEYKLKVPASYGPVPKEPAQEPPTLTDSALQSALPGINQSQMALSLGPAAEEGSGAGHAADAVPALNPN